jgi:3-phosphoshikimate 1-carboxyvinyltransferase
VTGDSRPIPVLTGPLDLVVRPPGSKSETIRALAAAALADGRSHLYAPLEADDTIAMATALQALGAHIERDGEPWTVDGGRDRLHPTATDLDANESGLSARILLAIAGSLDGVSRIAGRGRLPERPMGGIVEVLRAQGVEVIGDRLPIEVHGRGPLWGGRIEVDCTESSQFASAIMLVAPLMHEPATIELKGLSGSAGYLDMTASIMRRFGATVTATTTGYEIDNDGYRAADVMIEPDASAAVYPVCLAAVTGGRVVVEGLGEGSPQPDVRVAAVLEKMGCRVDLGPSRVVVDATDTRLQGVDVDMSAAPDGALAVAVACLFADGPSRIGGLGSLRHKESDRLAAISTEMSRLGADVEVVGDALVVRPGRLHGAEIDPHGDHRIAMSMAIAGTVVEGVTIRDPQVVNKTWPGFWDFLESVAAG